MIAIATTDHELDNSQALSQQIVNDPAHGLGPLGPQENL